MRKKYDVIVVGAGPAGTTAGYLLSGLGIKVLIIDKSCFPRPKLCGGLLPFKTYKLISRIFNLSETNLKNLVDFSSKKFKVFYKDFLLLEGNIEKAFYFVKRDKYDFFFLKKALQQGADLLEEEKIIDFNPHSKKVITSSRKQFRAKIIVGADGVNSIIRRRVPIFKQQEWKRNLGIAAEVSVKNFKIKEPRIYFGFANVGYGWAFPHNGNTFIGLGELIRNKENFLDKFKYFLNEINLKNWTNFEGHLIPHGNFIEKPIYKNTILIGDAAGFVDPLLGEGIFYAHRSGEIAAWSIYYHLKENRNLEETYITLLEKYLLPQMRYAKKIRKFFFRSLPILGPYPSKFVLKILQRQLIDMIQGIKFYYPLKKWKNCYEKIKL